MNPIGVLMSILALFLAYTFFTMYFGGTSSAKSEVNMGKLELSNDIDTMTILNSPVGDDVYDSIALAYYTDSWGSVQGKISKSLNEFLGPDINWVFDVDGNKVIKTGSTFLKNKLLESDAWVALPYNPEKKIVKVKLSVYEK